MNSVERSIYCAPPCVSTTVVNAGIIKLNWVRSPILKERQKRKHFTHLWRQEREGPSLLWEQTVKDRRRPRGNSNLTPVLPVKVTCNNAYPCFPPHQLNGREERARGAHISVVELISWKHEDWKKEITLTVRIWGDVSAGKSQTLFRTPCLLSVSPLSLSAPLCLCRSLVLSSAARSPPCSWGRRLPAVLGDHRSSVGTSPQRRNWCRDQKTRESYWDSQQQQQQKLK